MKPFAYSNYVERQIYMLDNKRIIIIRLSSIGDVLHATPVAESLKIAAPNCHLTWIVSKTAASLLKHNPYIDQLLIWSREDFAAAAKQHQFAEMRNLWHQLKTFYQTHKFDIALDIHGLFLTGLIIKASNTPRRIGMAKTKELNRFFMTEQALPASRPHVIYRYLSVLQSLNIQHYTTQMTLIPSSGEIMYATKFWLNHHVTSSTKVLFINPQTSWQSKNWSLDNFAHCINLLESSIKIFICGSAADVMIINKLCALTSRQITNIAGQTSLLELAALLKRADLLLTGDTGALHIAIAVNTPTISLWGPTRPEQYGPLDTTKHCVILSPFTCTACHKTVCRKHQNACINAILPETVATVINAHFNN